MGERVRFCWHSLDLLVYVSRWRLPDAPTVCLLAERLLDWPQLPCLILFCGVVTPENWCAF